MKKVEIEELNQRVQQLEELAWGMYRVLETYITFNDLPRGKQPEEENGVEKDEK